MESDARPFTAPWQAEAFAMAVRLNEAGVFDWSVWSTTLGAVIEADVAPSGESAVDTYYRCWLTALETILTDQAVVDPDALLSRKEAWRAAAQATPHGEPIALSAAARVADPQI